MSASDLANHDQLCILYTKKTDCWLQLTQINDLTHWMDFSMSWCAEVLVQVALILSFVLQHFMMAIYILLNLSELRIQVSPVSQKVDVEIGSWFYRDSIQLWMVQSSFRNARWSFWYFLIPAAIFTVNLVQLKLTMNGLIL